MDLIKLLNSGSDERTKDISDGYNKYNVKVVSNHSVLNRASCTCSPLDKQFKVHCEELMLSLNDESFELYNEEIRREIKSLAKLKEEDVDVAFGSSGSDLCYYPLLFSLVINPYKPILNLVTCPEELGSGSVQATAGKYFFSQSPYGYEVIKNSIVNSSLKVKTITYSARSEEGEIIDHRTNILETILANSKDYSIIASLVIGSKSGVIDNLEIIHKSPKNVQWVIDICQYRVSPKLVKELIALNCIILITGSKFYQAPPFCGAIIFPKSLSNKIASVTNIDKKMLVGFEKVFSNYDLPSSLSNLKDLLPKNKNFGLVSRWSIAIESIGMFQKIPQNVSSELIKKWNKIVKEALETSGGFFEVMPNTDKTLNSIISFRVMVNKRHLTFVELKKLYDVFCSPKSGNSDLGYDQVLIGQPVLYSGDKAFLRLAIGAVDIYKLAQKKESHRFDEDLKLISELKKIVKKLF